MSVRLHTLVIWLGLVMAAILFLFHLYLREMREVHLVWKEVERLNQQKEGVGLSDNVPILTDGEDVVLRKLNSFKNERSQFTVSRWKRDDRRGGGVGNEYENNITNEQIVKLVIEPLDNDQLHNFTEKQIEHKTLYQKKNNSNVKPNEKQSNFSLKQEVIVNMSSRFSLRSPFSLPTPESSLPLPQLLQCQWVEDLQHYLTSLPPSSHLISLVSSDYKYREVLLNWLILVRVHLSHPLTNILVLSLDSDLHHLLNDRDIPSVHIPVTCLLRKDLSLTHHVGFTQVHIMRVLVMRLLNHWGYDVANYDSDALVLHNPEMRYRELQDRHLIGSVGHFPHVLDHNWGTAVCIGAVLIRSSPQTELFWERMSKLLPQTTNDQARLNWALHSMGVVWDNPHSNMVEVIMTGAGRERFRVAVLPTKDICRQTCNKKRLKGYLIWHKGGAQNRDGKKAYASKGGLWRLRSNWQKINKLTSSKGVKWLSELAT